MNEFILLRIKAREKRDNAIAAARAEFHQTIAQLTALEQKFSGRRPRPKKLCECIREVMPPDRSFTCSEIRKALEALDPDRPWELQSIKNQLVKFRKAGVVRRVASKGGYRAAVYVRADAEIPEPPPAKTLADWLAELLAVRPMTELELTLAMLEAGYDGSKSKQTLRKSVGVTLRKNRKRFKRDGAKWTVI